MLKVCGSKLMGNIFGCCHKFVLSFSALMSWLHDPKNLFFEGTHADLIARDSLSVWLIMNFSLLVFPYFLSKDFRENEA